MTRKNPIAKDLRSPKYKKRVVANKKAYNRKKDSGVVSDSSTEGNLSVGGKRQNARCFSPTKIN